MRGSMSLRIILCVVAGAGWVAFRRYVGIPYEVSQAALIAGLITIVIGWPLGWLVGYFVSRDSDVDTTPFKIIAGMNLFAWVIPVVGVAVSTITLQFSRRSDAMPRVYWLLAAVGGWTAIATAAIGGAHEMQMREIRRQALEMNRVVDSGLRSTARCPYAAREVWSKEDIDKYCR